MAIYNNTNSLLFNKNLYGGYGSSFPGISSIGFGSGTAFPMGGFNLDFEGYWKNLGKNNIFGSSSSSSDSSSTTSNTSNSGNESKLAQKLKLEKEHADDFKQINELISQNEQTQKDIKKAQKQEDGSFKQKMKKAEFKKLGFWGKLKRGATNAIEGAIDCGFHMLGIESILPPRINWKNLGKAVGVAGATLALSCIPVVGPFVVPTLLAAGAVMGGGKVVGGAITAATTNDADKFDIATKGIGEGGVIFGLSAAGIRKAGGLGLFSKIKGLFTKSSTPATASVPTVQAPQASTGIFGKIKGFFTRSKNTTPATQTAPTAPAIQTPKPSMNMWQRAAYTNKTRNLPFWKQFGTNLKNTFYNPPKNFFSGERAQRGFLLKVKRNNIKLDQRIKQVDKDMAATSHAGEKAILEQEKMMLEAQKLANGTQSTRSQWNNLARESNVKTDLKKFEGYLSDLEKGKAVTLTRKDGSTFTLDSEPVNMQAFRNLLKRHKTTTLKETEALAKARKSSMRRIAISNKGGNSESAIQAYTGSSNRFAQIWNTFKPTFAKGGKFNWRRSYQVPGKGLKYAWNCFWKYPLKPYHQYMKMTRNGLTTGYSVEKTFFSKKEEGMFAGLLGLIGSMTGSDLVPDWMKDGKQVTISTTGEDGQTVEIAVKKDGSEIQEGEQAITESELKEMGGKYKEIRENMYKGIFPSTQESAANEVDKNDEKNLTEEEIKTALNVEA